MFDQILSIVSLWVR